MSLANLSIIEKDDLIRKMPKDSLQQELRQPSGNFPLYMIAARLKEVEDMEKEATARQMAEQSSQEAPTVAARLAMQAMPQGAMSSIGAMPSPQPRPDPQGQMAQQLAGPQQQMPTVRAQRGLKGAYAGDTAPIDAEMIAAAVRERQRKGDPRLYNLGRKAGFEQAGRKGAAPAAQIAAMLGLPSGVARAQERAFGGKSTLPPMQVESSPLALSRKGFTSPTRGVAPKAEQPAGLDLIKMLAQLSDDGGKEELPTVFAQSGASRPDINQLMARLAQRRIDEQGETLMSPSAANLVSQFNQAKQSKEAEVDVEEQSSEASVVSSAGLGGLRGVPDKVRQLQGELDGVPFAETLAAARQRAPLPQEQLVGGPDAFIPPPNQLQLKSRDQVIRETIAGLPDSELRRFISPDSAPPVEKPAPAMPPSQEEMIARRLRSRIGAGKQPVDTSQSITPRVMSQLAAVRGQNLGGPSVASQLLTGSGSLLANTPPTEKGEALQAALLAERRGSDDVPPAFGGNPERTANVMAAMAAQPDYSVESFDPDPTAGLDEGAAPRAGISSLVSGGGKLFGENVSAENLRGGMTAGDISFSPELQVASTDTAQKSVSTPVETAAIEIVPRDDVGTGNAKQGTSVQTVVNFADKLAAAAPNTDKAVEIDVPDSKTILADAAKMFPKAAERRTARGKIVSDFEKIADKIDAFDPVPKGLKDIRGMYEKRLEALETSGLPFMTAAAAVLKGNQQPLVAMTNAMIGYTAGDEKAKKQGLKIMGDIVKLDTNIATLEQAQLKVETEARQKVLEARSSQIEGNAADERAQLSTAMDLMKNAQALSLAKAKLEDSARNRANTLAASTFKVREERERFDTLVSEYMKQPGMTKVQAIEKAYEAMNPSSSRGYGMTATGLETAERSAVKKFQELETAAVNAHNQSAPPDRRISPTSAQDAGRRQQLLIDRLHKSDIPGFTSLELGILRRKYPPSAGASASTSASDKGDISRFD